MNITLCALFLFFKFQRFCPLVEKDACGPNKPLVIDATGENAFGEIISPGFYDTHISITYPHDADCQCSRHARYPSPDLAAFIFCRISNLKVGVY